MISIKTVLVTGADGTASQSIIKCLRLTNRYRIIVTSLDSLRIGLFMGDKGYIVSKDWTEFHTRLEDICRKESVEIIIPGSDVELDHFSQNKDLYSKFPPILIDWNNVKTARDKLEFQTILRLAGLPYLRTWTDPSLINIFPVIIKPRFGFGSNFIFKNVNDRESASTLMAYLKSQNEEPIAQEQAIGDEFSAMTLRAKDGELLASMCAYSVKKYGQSFKTIVKKGDLVIESMVEQLGDIIQSIGPLSAQMIKDKQSGEVKIFELNARFTGAQIIRAYAGQNMPDLAVRNWLDGIKEHPKITRNLIAYWYANYGYASFEEILETMKRGETKEEKIICPNQLKEDNERDDS